MPWNPFPKKQDDTRDSCRCLIEAINKEMMDINNAFRGYGYKEEAGGSVKRGFNVWSPDNENIINICVQD